MRLLVCLVVSAGVTWSVSVPAMARPQDRVIDQAITAVADVERSLAAAVDAFRVGDTAEAERLLAVADRQAAALPTPALQAEAFRQLAARQAAAGGAAAARPTLDRALGLFTAIGDRAGMARVRLQRGRLLQSMPDLLEAIRLFTEVGDIDNRNTTYVVAVYAQPDGPEGDGFRAEALAAVRQAATRDDECGVLHEWGDDLFNRGSYAEAQVRLDDALACFRQTTDRGREGRVLVSLGRLQRVHGRVSHALPLYEQALALQERAHDEPAAIQSLNAIAVTLGYLRRFDESAQRYEQALTRARAIKLPGTRVIVGNLGALYLDIGRYAEATELLTASLAEEPEEDFRVSRLCALSAAALAQSDVMAADKYAEQAMALSHDQGPVARLSALKSRADVRTAQRRFDEAAADLSAATATIDRMRAQVVPADYMKQGFGTAHQSAFDSLIDLLDAQGKSREALEVAERARSRAFLDLLATRSGSAAETTAAGNAGPRSVASALPPTADDIVAAARRLQSTVVAYWVAPSHTVVWVVNAGGVIAARRVVVPASRLAALVADASGLTHGGGNGTLLPAQGRRAWRELHRLLIDPIETMLPRAGGRLTIVPHGALLGLSFAGLRDARARYLLERFELHYLPSVSTMAWRAPAGRGTGALLVGDPGALTTEHGTLPALPWAAREVGAIRALVTGPVEVLTESKSDERSVRAAMSRPALVHIATHGVVSNDPALPSYLALRGEPGGSDSDGRLTADEIYDVPLSADLVVLSACRSALGPSTGDGVIGLTRAFLASGAGAVMAAMWDVPDQTTFEVMRRFYARRNTGASNAAALRAAQLSVLRDLRRNAITTRGVAVPESPWLWAGFVLVGEP